MREKKAQESTLAIEYKHSVEYLQQFLPNNNYFQYIYFDMAKLNKTWVFETSRIFEFKTHIPTSSFKQINFEIKWQRQRNGQIVWYCWKLCQSNWNISKLQFTINTRRSEVSEFVQLTNRYCACQLRWLPWSYEYCHVCYWQMCFCSSGLFC